MNRRGWLATVVGVLLLVALAAAGWQPASGNTPEGLEGGPLLTVTPSDELPVVQLVDLYAQGFFPPDTATTGPVTVTVHQCDTAEVRTCGPDSLFVLNSDFILDAPRSFTVTRVLGALFPVDCAVTKCEVVADAGTSGVARHHLTFAAAPVTTPPTVPPDTTTTGVTPATTTSTRPPVSNTAPATTATTRSRATTTVPPTTRTTRATTTTTTRPTTTSTSAPSTTTTTTAPPTPPARPPLVAVTTQNRSSGPPGGTLRVTGTGYTCGTVYFFFDGVRIGSARPDDAGNATKGGLSVPGDVGTGRHDVTSSCQASGGAVEQVSSFDVVPVSVHRPAFVTSLAEPSQVSLAPGRLLTSAAIAVGALLLIAFPFELFNSTMEENYDEIRAWFRLAPSGVDETKTRSRTVSFFVLTVVTAVACGFLSPDFGWNMTSLVLGLGMFVALIVMAVVFSLPADLGIHRQYGEWGTLNFLPGSVVVGIVLVALSRLFHFQPGYFYGALAGLAFRSALTEGDQGRMTAANWLFSLVVSVGAWFARMPVSAAAARPGASVWWVGLEVCLAMIFLWGVEGLAVAMLPLRFLDGRKVFRWSRLAWALLFFLGLFATFHVLLAPGSGYVGHTTGGVAIGVMALYAVFGLGSVGFWAYFRYRPQRWAGAGG